PADGIDAGHDDAGCGLRPAALGGGGEAPDRARQVAVEPVAAERLAARQDRALQPGIPRLDEGMAEPPRDEIAARRQLAVEARRHRRVGHSAGGHRKSSSWFPANGLMTLFA